MGNVEPNNIIFKCRDALLAFRGVLCELDMPTVDFPEVVMEIIDSVRVDDDTDHELQMTAFYLAEGAVAEGETIENMPLTDEQEERIRKAVVRLGKELKEEIQFHHGYHLDGLFRYELERLINNDTLLLKKKLE